MRRFFPLILVVVFTSFSTISLSQESELGIDYLTITKGDQQLAEILAGGEVEWMLNAKEKLKTREYWEAASIQIITEEIPKRVKRKLMEATPKMLLNFIKLPKENYPLLYAVGTAYEAYINMLKSHKRLCTTLILTGSDDKCPELLERK